MSEESRLSSVYGEQYYRTSCGPIPYSREEPHWHAFFQAIADRLILSLNPNRVLDAGCAMGILVEAFWDRGVECLGIDISEFAISRVRSDVAPYCRVASITDPLPGRFDLIVCIEVLEHLSRDESKRAVANLTAATDVVLFSSTPSDLSEPTHVNVCPTGVWLNVFAEHGFFPDVNYDASFVAPHAMLLRRTATPVAEMNSLFTKLVNQRVRTHEKMLRIAELETRNLELETRLAAAQSDAQQQAEILKGIERVSAELSVEILQMKEIQKQSDLAVAHLRAEFATEILQMKEIQKQSDLAVKHLRVELFSEIRQMQSFQKQSELTAAHLRAEVQRSHRRIAQLYDSRIWRTLVAAGGLVDKVVGRGHLFRRSTGGPAAAETHMVVSNAPPGDLSEPSGIETSFPGDYISLQIDAPSSGSLILSGSVLSITGWAVAETGVERVEIWIDSVGPQYATYGLMRPDVRDRYPSISDAEHGGFSWYRSTSEIAPGPHRVRVKVISRAGHDIAAYTTFRLDTRSLYEVWSDLHTPSSADIERLRIECRNFTYKPKISIVTPVYRTPEEFIRRCATSVRNQAYENWEWVIVDDYSQDDALTRVLASYTADSRIQTNRLTANEGIAGATNMGLRRSTGDFVAFLDHDDELAPDALYEVVRALNGDLSIDVLYSDEDKLGPDGNRQDGFFKPDWSPDLLLSMNYVCHFLVCRRDLLDRVGGLRTGFEGSQDYDLILRLSEQTSRIHRIPRMLYHWRIHPGSTAMMTGQKPKASDAGRRAIEQHLQRTGADAKVEEVGICRYRVRYAIKDAAEVAIIIPTGGNEKLRTAIQSVVDKTSYPNFRIVVIDNSSDDTVKSWLRSYMDRGVRIDWVDCRRQPFNFSALCNRGAAYAGSAYLLFLNDDTAVITPDWIESMLEHGQRPEVGAVGAQLLFPNDTIQHAGVVVGIFGVAAHVFRGMDASTPHYSALALSQSIRNCSAVTGACLLIRKEIFDRVGGFDEVNLPTCFQDVDLCLKIVDAHLSIVYTPYARLYHYESATKRVIARPAEIEYMEKHWQRYILEDPFYNPNLSRRSDGYEPDLVK